MRLTNKYGLPQPIVDAVANDDYTRGNANISVTSLISPPRQVALIGAHWDELEEDVSDRVYSLFGRAIHVILEGSGPVQKILSFVRRLLAGENVLGLLGALLDVFDKEEKREQRLYMQVGDWVVSGAMDRTALLPWNDGTSVIQDWKTAKTDELIRGVKLEREQQLNIYRVLAELNGQRIGALQAVFILRDWSKVRAAAEAKRPHLGSAPASDYPVSQVVTYDIPMWPIEETYRFIAERVALHKAAQEDYGWGLRERAGALYDMDGRTAQDALPACDSEERWEKAPVLALMKEGNKKASKLVDTLEAAEEYIAAHPKDVLTVVPRPGEAIRCAYYCLAAQVCEQRAEMLNG